MQLSRNTYSLYAKLIGGLLTIYGGGSILAYSLYVITGDNGLEAFTNGIGFIFLALMGAFALPLGISMLTDGEARNSLLRIAGIALFLNGALRLMLLNRPELVELTGVATPIGEFVVFAMLGLSALMIRPTSE